MKKLLLLISLMLFSGLVRAQDFDVPRDYAFETQEDYVRYEPEVLAGIDWIINTPMNKSGEKRMDINKFLMEWMTATPTVIIAPGKKVSKSLFTPNRSLLSSQYIIVFYGGWVKHALADKNIKWKELEELSPQELIDLNEAGIDAVIAYYNRNKGALGKDKEVEKIIKMKGKGTLRQFLASDSISK